MAGDLNRDTINDAGGQSGFCQVIVDRTDVKSDFVQNRLPLAHARWSAGDECAIGVHPNMKIRTHCLPHRLNIGKGALKRHQRLSATDTNPTKSKSLDIFGIVLGSGKWNAVGGRDADVVLVGGAIETTTIAFSVDEKARPLPLGTNAATRRKVPPNGVWSVWRKVGEIGWTGSANGRVWLLLLKYRQNRPSG